MAVTKNHPIDTTLKKAIDYILNPDKTDDRLLVYSYGCEPETADIEFEWTRNSAPHESPHLARHIIQAFEPGETTPQEAHEIGKRWAEKILGGKYEFVLTTHIDCGHINNHIICNDVSFRNKRHIHINNNWYKFAKRESDKLCREYGLSVIEPSGEKSKSYKEYTAAKDGTSWKAKLKEMIDALIPLSSSFDDFIRLMTENGYEVKRGKYISFRAVGQERFTRSKTLGARYTEEAITERITGRKIHKRNDKRISLIIDIQNNIKAQQSKGYEHWAKLHNLKEASKTINYLTEHGLTTYEDLEKRSLDVHNQFSQATDEIKSVEARLEDVSLLRKHIEIYTRLRPVYLGMSKAMNKAKYEKQHESELILYEASKKYLSSVQKGGKLPTLKSVNAEYYSLMARKRKLYDGYKSKKKAVTEIDIIKRNVDMLLDDRKGRERERHER